MNRKKNLTAATMAGVSFFFALPILLTLLLSLRFEERFPTLAGYWELLVTDYTFLRYFWNAAGYSLIITAASILLAFPLGFLFAKVRFPGRDALFFVYIVTMMMPFQATLLPNYIQLRDWELLNTPWALILPLAFSPYAVFLFRQFLKDLPQEQLDAMLLDTNSTFRIFRHVVFPHVRRAAAALAVILFCESWNMVEPVLIFAAKDPAIHPLSVTLADLPQNVAFQSAVVYMLPILFLFLLFKETLASSMEHFRWEGRK